MNYSTLLKADARNYWWNEDFTHLMAHRMGLSGIQTVLDVGCGAGHWSRVIAPLVAPNAHITGVDIKEEWITEAQKIHENFTCNNLTFTFQQESVYELPFSNNCFDLVTCQTLLIYLGEPLKALAEMLRVLKPGGKILLAEPNNYVHLVRSNTAQEQLTLQEKLKFLEFYMTIEEGKKKLGQGDMMICAQLPSLLEKVGARVVRFDRSDKLVYCHPPYENAEQKAQIAFIEKLIAEDSFYCFPPDSVRQFFEVASEDKVLFEEGMALSHKLNSFYKKAIQDKTLAGPFGGEMLFVMGEKI